MSFPLADYQTTRGYRYGLMRRRLEALLLDLRTFARLIHDRSGDPDVPTPEQLELAEIIHATANVLQADLLLDAVEEMRTTIKHLCTRCGKPITGALVGDGDGAGQRFRHRECTGRTPLEIATLKGRTRGRIIHLTQQAGNEGRTVGKCPKCGNRWTLT